MQMHYSFTTQVLVRCDTYCLSSSLKSSKLLFFFSFSVVFFEDWNINIFSTKLNNDELKEYQSAQYSLAVLTFRLSKAKNWGGVSRGRKLFVCDSKRDLGLYNFPLFSSAAASSKRKKKDSTAVYLSKIYDFASPKMIGNPLHQYLILLSAFKFWTVNKFNATKHRLRNTLYTYNFCAPFVAFAIPPRTKALTLPSPPPSKAARNSS